MRQRNRKQITQRDRDADYNERQRDLSMYVQLARDTMKDRDREKMERRRDRVNHLWIYVYKQSIIWILFIPMILLWEKVIRTLKL